MLDRWHSSRWHSNFLILQRILTFHVNHLLSRWFTWNVKIPRKCPKHQKKERKGTVLVTKQMQYMKPEVHKQKRTEAVKTYFLWKIKQIIHMKMSRLIFSEKKKKKKKEIQCAAVVTGAFRVKFRYFRFILFSNYYPFDIYFFAWHFTQKKPRWLSWMRRPTGDQEVAGSTPAEVGNILSWRLIMKYFLRSFSPFRWFKKGSCQFLAKECAQYWLTA